MIRMLFRYVFLLILLLASRTPGHAGGVVISEFLAANDGGLQDADGDTPGWIEIYNGSPLTVDLAGWHLACSPTNLSFWTFPSTNLPPGGFLLVFASGKDRAVTGGQLHANFQLQAGGGYLALVKPDGLTIAHAFAPSYPRQRVNVSYGLEPKAVPVLSLDVNDDDSGEIGAANTEVGFSTMTLSSNPSTFSGITAKITAIGTTTLDDRDRDVPVQSAQITQDQLYDDYIYSTSTVNGTGLALTLSGLKASRGYTIKVWSVDPGGTTTGARYSDWTETASGITNVIVTGYSWNVSLPLTNDGQYTFGGTVRSSAAGELRIEGRRNGGASTTVCLNAIQLFESGAASYDDGTQRYFTPPSPAAANGPGCVGLVGDTQFSRDRGIYGGAFTVAITCLTTNALIYWTTNGSAPTQTSGTLYTNPVSITGTTFLRARAFLSNNVPSDVDTHTYLFLGQVLRQSAIQPGYPVTWQASYPADYGMDQNIVNHAKYGLTLSNDMRSLPILSIVAAHDDLWNATTGIYNNSTSIGPAWQRSASVELFHPDGTTEFGVNCGIEIHGNASRDNARTGKHSFNLIFKSDYGPSKLRYDLFGSPVREFDRLVLRSMGFCDSWATRYSDTSIIAGTSYMGLRYRPESALYLRDTWVKDSLMEMGQPATRSTFVHLYINGLYWGLYSPSERLDANFFISHYGGRDGDWDVMAGDETYNLAEVRDGNKNDWNQVMVMVDAGVTSYASYQALGQLVDLTNLADYMLVHGVAEAEDWPFHNWYAAHRRATNGLPATRWTFYAWDQEICLDRLVRRDRINVNSADTPSRIYAQLRANPEFRVLFGDRVQKHLFNGGALTPAANVARWQALATRIDRAIVGESARWGDARKFAIGANPGTGQTFTRDEWWVPETQRLYTNLFPTLTDAYIALYRNNSLYPTVAAPVFSRFGGEVPAGFALSITHSNASGTVFLTLDGSDPRVPGSGAVAAGARAWSQPLVFNTTTQVRARVLIQGQWSALVEASFYPPQDLSGLGLSEVMFNPPAVGITNGEEFEFIELWNSGPQALNLSGLVFTKGITFTFTNGTILGPGQFLVLARNSAAFAAKYPGVAMGGIYTGKLDNAGETITLSHPGGTTVFSLTYQDTAPWPAAADGWGFSMVPATPGASQASDDGSKWRASAISGGSPGRADPPVFIAPIKINEVLAHTDPPQVDAIELLNPTSANVNIGGWFLTDDPAMPLKYRVPMGTTIAAGGLLVVDATQFDPTPGIGNSFALDSTGDQVWLFSGDASGRLSGYSHGVEFGATFNGASLGRLVNEVGDEFFPLQTMVTLGRTNAGPRVGPVVINEIHYHPLDAGYSFVELLNTTTNPVPLFAPAFPTNQWRVSGLGFTFPANTTLPPGGLVLLTATNAVAFRAHYTVPDGVPVFGPYSGLLQEGGENLEIQQPDNPNLLPPVPYVAVEQVRYHARDPWPAAADGAGFSLQRRDPSAYGNTPSNWIAAEPTPGRLTGVADSDHDGLPDLWEVEHQTNPFLDDANADPDGDGFSNLQEYLAGTDPRNAESSLLLRVEMSQPTGVVLNFLAVSNRSYSVLHNSGLAGGWLNLQDVSSQSQDRLVTITNRAGDEVRFYRVVTPAQP